MIKHSIRSRRLGFLLILVLSFIVFVNTKKQRHQKPKGDGYGDGFYNHSKCLYVYIGGGEFGMITADGIEVNENLTTKSLIFNPNKTSCLTEEKDGRVAFTFKLNDDHVIKSISISMKIFSKPRQSIWGIHKMDLTVLREDGRKKTFQLEVEREIYAGKDFSYSCNDLQLETRWKSTPGANETKGEPHGWLSLQRFQLQPFPESPERIFADSFDCAVWFTIPTLLGFILFIFMLSLGIYPAYLLANIEPGDFKYVKEGQQFTQTQMESSKQNK